MKGLNQKLWLLKHDKSYERYLSQIETGNVIKVYYLGGDIIQIEKNSKIVIPKTEFENEQKRRLWFVIVAPEGMTVLSIFHFKR